MGLAGPFPLSSEPLLVQLFLGLKAFELLRPHRQQPWPLPLVPILLHRKVLKLAPEALNTVPVSIRQWRQQLATLVARLGDHLIYFDGQLLAIHQFVLELSEGSDLARTLAGIPVQIQARLTLPLLACKAFLAFVMSSIFCCDLLNKFLFESLPLLVNDLNLSLEEGVLVLEGELPVQDALELLRDSQQCLPRSPHLELLLVPQALKVVLELVLQIFLQFV